MERTTITTMEVTEIDRGNESVVRDISSLIKDYLGADDVVVTKVQTFEMPDEPAWTPFEYLIRLAFETKRGRLKGDELAEAILRELTPCLTAEEMMRCLR